MSTTKPLLEGSGTGSVAWGKKIDLYRRKASSSSTVDVKALNPQHENLAEI
jgi:hypothetical protein